MLSPFQLCFEGYFAAAADGAIDAGAFVRLPFSPNADADYFSCRHAAGQD